MGGGEKAFRLPQGPQPRSTCVVGQMQGPQHRCGQQREEGISFPGLGARTLGPAAAPHPSAGFKLYIASQI